MFLLNGTVFCKEKVDLITFARKLSNKGFQEKTKTYKIFFKTTKNMLPDYCLKHTHIIARDSECCEG